MIEVNEERTPSRDFEKEGQTLKQYRDELV